MSSKRVLALIFVAFARDTICISRADTSRLHNPTAHCRSRLEQKRRRARFDGRKILQLSRCRKAVATVARSRVAGKSGFRETRTTTQWITGRHAFGCIVDGDESSFAGYGCHFPFPSGTLPKTRSPVGGSRVRKIARDRFLALPNVINRHHLPTPSSASIFISIQLSKMNTKKNGSLERR